jgi:uncharacterized RDD family membrane protein YckC
VTYEVRDRWLLRRERGTRCEVMTPEGIPLPLTIAGVGDRAVAFVLDLLVMGGLVVGLYLAALFSRVAVSEGWGGAVLVLGAFLVRSFYFVVFEMRWQGATPGKRWAGIRVVDAHGGPLTAEAVVARNLTREVELFLPFVVLVRPSAIWPDAPGWARTASVVWLLVFAAMPLFNRYRMRVGDLIAGTMVVLAPRAFLLADQGASAARRAGQGDVLQFTEAQLDVYGIFELQVLEDVLRRDRLGGLDRRAMETVRRRIQAKIRWDRSQGDVSAERFLRDFYAALRARLERRMLLGHRKEDKYS